MAFARFNETDHLEIAINLSSRPVSYKLNDLGKAELYLQTSRNADDPDKFAPWMGKIFRMKR